MHYRLLIILLVLFGIGIPVSAHHSFPASYVVDEIVTLDGVVEGWLWRNPHPFIFLNVEDQSGKTATWHIEFANATAMALRGLTPESFQKGDRLLVVGNPGRQGRHSLHYEGLWRPADNFEFGELENMDRGDIQ
jgi:hypothetical protein